MASELTFEEVDALLRYEEGTGRLFWKERPVSMFPSERIANSWNARRSGKEAFTAVERGYKVGAIHHKKYQAHRVCWLLATGDWPVHNIDHISGVPGDNRLVNLRDVPQADNCKNKKMRRDNSSGVTGVYWNEDCRKWSVEIKDGSLKKRLGMFSELEKAARVRKAEEASLGYHPNHGR